MFTLRKLILKEWFIFFFGAAIVLLMILSLGHVLNGLLKASNDFKSIFTDLGLEIPTFLVKIFPVSCLVASLFSINKLKSRNELTSIFASGFSRRQFVILIGFAGVLVGFALFMINGYLVPFAKHKQALIISRAASAANPSVKNPISINALQSGRIWFKSQGYFFSYSSFDARSNTIYDLSLYYYDKTFHHSEQFSARTASFLSENKWLLSDGVHITNLENTTFPTPKTFTKEEVVLNETVSDFKKINADISTLNIWKLYDYINVLRVNKINDNEYFVTFLDKFASGFTCLVLAILASIALFNPNRRNSSFGANIALVLSFTFIYWFIYSYFMTLGQTSKISPYYATFSVPFVFVIYLTFYFIYHRKLR